MVSHPVRIPRNLTVDLSRKQVLDLSQARLKSPCPLIANTMGSRTMSVDTSIYVNVRICRSIGNSASRAPERGNDIAADFDTSISSPYKLPQPVQDSCTAP